MEDVDPDHRVPALRYAHRRRWRGRIVGEPGICRRWRRDRIVGCQLDWFGRPRLAGRRAGRCRRARRRFRGSIGTARLAALERGFRTFRVASSDRPHRRPLGGLWRLMSLSRPGSGGAPVVNNVETAAPQSAAPIAGHPAPPAPGGHRSTPPAPTPPASAGSTAPSSDGASAPSIGSGGTASGPDGSGGSSGAVPPTDPFHSHQTRARSVRRSVGGGGFDPDQNGGGGVPASGGGVRNT